MIMAMLIQLMMSENCERFLKRHVVDYDPYDVQTQEYLSQRKAVENLFRFYREGK